MKFEIVKLSKVALKLDYVSSKIAEFQKLEQRPTYTGLLTFLGVTPRDISEMSKSTDRNVLSAMRLLELYKQHLESEMEKKLIYQEDLPKFYNHKSLEFVLKKSNPAKYGDKVVAISTNQSGNVKLDDLKNESGFSITEETKS